MKPARFPIRCRSRLVTPAVPLLLFMCVSPATFRAGAHALLQESANRREYGGDEPDTLERHTNSTLWTSRMGRSFIPRL
jgi:hypothetical protein